MVVAEATITRARPHIIRAIKSNNVRVVMGLLKNGFPPTEKLDGLPIMHFAVMNGGNRELIEAMIDCGCDLGSTSSDGRNIAHIACRMARSDLLEAIV